MSLPVVVAVCGPWEAPLVTGLERSGGDVHVARRCADLAELLAAATAGLGRAALLSADLPHLDRDVLARLTGAGVAVVGVLDPGRPADAARLDALGVGHVVPADAAPEVVATALGLAVDELARVPAPGATPGPDAAPQGVGGRSGGGGDGTWTALLDPPPGGPAPAPAAVRTPQLVAVWGPVGSPGRTTVAVTLAAELAGLTAGAGDREGVVLVDADTYGPSVAQTLGLLDESAGLAAAVRTALVGGLDDARLARLAPVVLPGLRVLTGLPRTARWPELRAAGLDVVWERARQIARWVVVDCGFSLETDEELSFDGEAPRRNAATLSALLAADVVLAVGSADPIGLQRLVRGLSDLEEAVGRPATRVVVTRVRHGAVGPAPEQRVVEALGRFAGVADPLLVPDDRRAVDAALLAGRTLTEHAPESPARTALAGLAASLAGVVPPRGRRLPRRPARIRS